MSDDKPWSGDEPDQFISARYRGGGDDPTRDRRYDPRFVHPRHRKGKDSKELYAQSRRQDGRDEAEFDRLLEDDDVRAAFRQVLGLDQRQPQVPVEDE